jgi:hypothetical protein
MLPRRSTKAVNSETTMKTESNAKQHVIATRPVVFSNAMRPIQHELRPIATARTGTSG